MYKCFVKRFFDIFGSLFALIILFPLLGIIALLVRIKIGTPVLFKQKRPGRKDKNGTERIFTLYKFCTMANKMDENGKLLPDDVRLTPFGARLRKTSLDELPELWNILKGDMSLIGPRPQLIRDMLFMTDAQRNRHSVRPGLSGLAQINGRNCIEWKDKLDFDLMYLDKISFYEDMRIFFMTIYKVFTKEGIATEGMATAEDLCDYLLRTGKITRLEYEDKLSLEPALIKQIG